MFLFSWRGVLFVLVLCTLYSYLLITGSYDRVTPWIDGSILVVIGYLFIRSWLG
jgi:hypothetical protein